MINQIYKKYFFKYHYDQVYINNYNKITNLYKLVLTKCLCGATSDRNIISHDRCGNDYKIVLCKNCGLIRAKKYFLRNDILDIYTNIYNSERSEDTPEALYQSSAKSLSTKESWEIIEEYVNLSGNRKLDIIDIGGGGGGFLDKYKTKHNCYVSDFESKWLENAAKNNINVIQGGIEEILSLNKNFDLIILNHVIEHWSNFETEITNLKKICKENKTKIFIEVPGIDSLKHGRREADIVGDVIIYHYHYFSSYTLSELMKKYGFDCLYSDSRARLIFEPSLEYSDHKIVNNYNKVFADIKTSLFKKIYYSLKKILVNNSPNFIKLILIKKFFRSFVTYFSLKKNLEFLFNIITYLNYLKIKNKYKKIIHLHVPQCGGNSLNYFLKLNLGFRLLQFRKNSVLYLENYLKNNEFIITLHSGIDFMKNSLSRNDFFVILSLRNPKNRILSNYYRNKKLHDEKNTKYITLEQFLNKRINQKLDNVYVRYLSKKFNYDGYCENKYINEDDLKNAIYNLKYINHINIIDNKKCFKILIKKLGIIIPISKYFNLQKNKVSDSKYPDISKTENELLEKLIFYDLKLYNLILKNEY